MIPTETLHRPVKRHSHSPDAEPVPFDACEADGQDWPCRVARETEDADRLYAAMRPIVGRFCSPLEQQDAVDAMRAHEALREARK